MDEDVLHVSTTVRPTGELTVEVRGYLDERGGSELARMLLFDLPGSPSTIDIDLKAISLFSCSGVRRLLTALEDLQGQGRDVSLVGVRQSLQKILHFST